MNAMARAPAARRPRGFTLIELLFVVVIVAIFASLAGPPFRQMIAAQRIRAASSAITETLWIARSEAIKRNDTVSIKFVNAGANSPISGWDVTQSADGSGTSLHHHDGYPTLAATTSSGGNLLFTFNAFGRLTSGDAWVKLVASGVTRWVCISAGGKVLLQESACS